MKRLLVISILLCQISCATHLLKKQFKAIGAYEPIAKIEYLQNGEKHVAFVGMHHVGRKEFYNDVASTIDSLQQHGYTVFYESVREEINTDSMQLDTINRKYRKLMGFAVEEYIDTSNNTFLGRLRLPNTYKLVNQPDYPDLKVNMTTAVKADVPLSVLIDSFEHAYTQFRLDSCDFLTPLESPYYSCKVDPAIRHQFDKEYILQFRNRHLAKTVQQYEKDKIVIIFGNLHFSGFVAELQTIDRNWEHR